MLQVMSLSRAARSWGTRPPQWLTYYLLLITYFFQQFPRTRFPYPPKKIGVGGSISQAFNSHSSICRWGVQEYLQILPFI